MNGGQLSTMPPETAVARALYKKRGLTQQCSPLCIDHFAHDYSPEASACRDEADAALAALKAAGYGFWTHLDEAAEDEWYT